MNVEETLKIVEGSLRFYSTSRAGGAFNGGAAAPSTSRASGTFNEPRKRR